MARIRVIFGNALMNYFIIGAILYGGWSFVLRPALRALVWFLNSPNPFDGMGS